MPGAWRLRGYVRKAHSIAQRNPPSAGPSSACRASKSLLKTFTIIARLSGKQLLCQILHIQPIKPSKQTGNPNPTSKKVHVRQAGDSVQKTGLNIKTILLHQLFRKNK